MLWYPGQKARAELLICLHEGEPWQGAWQHPSISFTLTMQLPALFIQAKLTPQVQIPIFLQSARWATILHFIRHEELPGPPYAWALRNPKMNSALKSSLRYLTPTTGLTNFASNYINVSSHNRHSQGVVPSKQSWTWFDASWLISNTFNLCHVLRLSPRQYVMVRGRRLIDPQPVSWTRC